jgi:hypothetical protein
MKIGNNMYMQLSNLTVEDRHRDTLLYLMHYTTDNPILAYIPDTS